MPHPDPKILFRALSANVIVGPDHPFYVPLLADATRLDPIERLARRIGFEESESASLITGFRGNGKSTQLRRLKKLLEDEGHTVFLIDLLDWMMMSKPIEVSDFLLTVVGALDEAQRAQGFGAHTGFFDGLRDWLSATVGAEDVEVEVQAGVVGLKAKLKSNPTFRERLQEHLRARVSQLVLDARAYVSHMVDTIRRTTGDPNRKVVVLVDSCEQLRGSGDDATRVQTSAHELFVNQADNLQFPKLHVVYTFPPSLLPLAQNLGRAYGGRAITTWPNVRVRTRHGGRADEAGIRTLRTVVDKRFAPRARLISDAHLDQLAAASGGDVRDFFRLVRECLVDIDPQSGGVATDDHIKRVIAQLRRELLPIAEDDKRWLARIHERKDVALENIASIPTLIRFFDNNLIMNYENGEAWYDVHPLVIDELPTSAEG